MLFVIRNGKVFATHDDNQEILDKYPQGCEIIQIDDLQVKAYLQKFGEEVTEIPDPRNEIQEWVDIRKVGALKQRLADLEEALAALLGGAL